ncbi:unnamed protein product [Tilletia laevis]|uniref:mRNA decay factor PAT1 domain-containing protein n=1 Tax=Tilletia caries TaxID=13290 RepID=A0A177UGT6_9BASI|nr:hypothetical protein CF336_g5969 [Tilletia laevis]KAE8260828.1 hypothetical protein A4X03_0g3690 [Tilletia caries]KAE8198539.1 hypothetical protein CF335_g4362 [Tilletia laevis]CAD6884028.1 unnamed protein product [Tilletia caries]CAD6921412.1 unnamed protein product [Tilletia caries]
MSFFGFDTTLPRDRKEAAEDIEVYTWGEHRYDGLADHLDDDQNTDTFAAPATSVGTDFDFTNTPGFTKQPSNNAPASNRRSTKNSNAFATSIEDLWALPPFAATTAGFFGAASPAVVNAQADHHQHQQQQHQASAPAAHRSLADIEAELLGGRSAPQQHAQATPPQQLQQLLPFQQNPNPQAQAAPAPAPAHGHGHGHGRPPLTLAEVEAQMLARRTAATAGTSTATPPTIPAQLAQQATGTGTNPAAALPNIPGLAALLGQHIGTPPQPTLSLLPQAPPQPLPQAISATLQSGQHVTAQQRAAAHIASMHALLNGLPPHVRGAVLALPPNLHFEALQNVIRQFPTLLPASRPGSNVEGGPPVDPPDELVQHDAVRYMMDRAAKRVEQEERAEVKRRMRMAKIHSMSSHNNIMTNSDKDFITRIQVSQLVTNDPYSDDFYAHIYFAIRGNPNRPTAAAAAAAAGNGIAPAPNAKGGKRKTRQLTRRENAMLRMQQQVQRLVENRKDRMEKLAAGQPESSEVAPAGATPSIKEGDQSTSSTVAAAASQTATLAGALGRISLGTAKYPKPMLSLSPAALRSSAGMATDAVRRALAEASLDGSASIVSQLELGPDGKRAPLGRYQVLSILERLYDLVMSLEQRRRDVPGAGAGDEDTAAAEAAANWQVEQDALTATLWKELRVLEPLDISDPHPFVSILSTVKGQRFLPRALRHLSAEQTLTVLTMVVASFQTLDVVRQSAALDAVSASVDAGAMHGNVMIKRVREDLERQTEAFSSSIVPSMLGLMGEAPLKIVSGMIALFVERNDVVKVARTRPGVAFLTIFLSRAETLKQSGAAAAAAAAAAASASAPEPSSTPETSAEDLKQWNEIFNLLFHRLSSPGVLPSLFPSARPHFDSTPFSLLSGSMDDAAADEPVWNLCAALAVSASMEQQQVLVQELRERILENVFKAREVGRRRVELLGASGPGAGEEIDATDVRIRNVNLLLHALNLDATQITI